MHCVLLLLVILLDFPLLIFWLTVRLCPGSCELFVGHTSAALRIWNLDGRGLWVRHPVPYPPASEQHPPDRAGDDASGRLQVREKVFFRWSRGGTERGLPRSLLLHIDSLEERAPREICGVIFSASHNFDGTCLKCERVVCFGFECCL